ncbi:class I SAM-dependent DNA methyltransferase [Draconibacterium sp. IB214405]|uniref:type I restriction-modification system subunit M n=1 Tax=Draconibacterium sp. IB214405 TaxID=3097352 RepID=UPI002A102129|nr:class I SAM-dependent DNA methyltransferase [Draconibacterium sp. IB214405]MDX8341560.1 class I SAM-dependent DNA methyltransferase [Draconibacterium sp. IB214405]
MINKERLENLSQEVWKGAIKLRGKFKAKDYPSVILPMIMIRRIESVLEEKREQFRVEILAKTPNLDSESLNKRIKIKEQNEPFYNKSNWTLKGILDESSSQVETNFRDYINSYSSNIDDVIDKFNYRYWVTEMVKAKRLSSIIRLVAEEDFSPKRLSNIEMGYVYEHLLQLFSQDDAKDTGEHFTPREIIRIMVDLMEIDFNPETATKAISIYDPACGTGGMLSIAKEHIVDKATTDQGLKNAEDLVLLNGQELLPQNYALCKADMILKGEAHINITHGNSLIPDIESIEDDGDQHAGGLFDYLISNPPFGVDWSDYKKDVERLKTSRYAWGMSPSNDGALLFLLSMIEKMKPKEQGGSKIAILFNGSPLSNGDATQGESEIRRHILQNDLLDTIVMLPDQMFYNTGIYTYIWLLNNNKPDTKKDHVLIINARSQSEKEPKSFGNKRNRIIESHRNWIHNQFENWGKPLLVESPEKDMEHSKLFHTTDFAFHKVEVVFWQEDENGKQMWINEDFDVKLSNANAKKRFELYGDYEMLIDIESPFVENECISIQFKYDGKKPMETLVAEYLKKKVNELKQDTLKDIKKWFEQQSKSISYYHRHYIVDNEYIPFDRTQEDKEAYINAFLAKEIDYEIIRCEEYDQLGYEILPNKYFYKYQEPTPSDVLIKEFWELEEDAEKLLNEIRDL